MFYSFDLFLFNSKATCEFQANLSWEVVKIKNVDNDGIEIDNEKVG